MSELLLNMDVMVSSSAMVGDSWMRHQPQLMRFLPVLKLRGGGSSILMVKFDLGLDIFKALALGAECCWVNVPQFGILVCAPGTSCGTDLGI